MKVVITIIGYDRVGIVAMVSQVCAQSNVNILDINQNIMNGFFNMVMIADTDKATLPLHELQEKLQTKGEELGLQIKVQSEDIFKAMHTI
ncbi:MAG: ACT domain-containing protein [Alphaproteobacteria bacterium]|nr:ACT domain-containing protein [Alphaproteobacteria bacterium]